MNIIQAIILGIVQGLTEFLPISSSGHIELGKALLGIEARKDLTFTVVVHGGTVLSTIVVFRKDIAEIYQDLREGAWNESTQYLAKIFISMIPVVIVGLLFQQEIEAFFFGNIFLVGNMLLVTGGMLVFTYFSRDHTRDITFKNAFIVGLAQAFALLPGISRSGSTIATALLLRVKKEVATKFSFLMVLIPIIAANLKDLIFGDFGNEKIGFWPLTAGFLAAFIAGLLACSWMVNIVKKGKLIYFAIYCFIIGMTAIYVSLQ
ncbi:MAG: undecaprenyl-diphosphate phosphatase [Cytophagales bacterium]|nr:undecaprenyl-diphosphate phosphatase [Cytophagales bacterium]